MLSRSLLSSVKGVGCGGLWVLYRTHMNSTETVCIKEKVGTH